MAPEAWFEASYFNPNCPGMGLNFVFSNFDSDLGNIEFNNVHLDNFNFEDAIKEAKLLLGPRKTFQELGASTSSLQVSHLPLLEPANKKYDALTLDEAYYNLDNSTCQEPIHLNEIRAQK